MPLNTLHDAISNIGSTLFAPRWIHSPLLWLPLIGAILSGSEPVHHLEESFGLPLLFELRGPRQAPDHVVLVTIDELTATSLSLPRSVSRWPRSVHACVIEQFLATAKQIAIDINFVGKSSPPIFVSTDSDDKISPQARRFQTICHGILARANPDEALADAFAAHGDVYLVQPYGEAGQGGSLSQNSECSGFDDRASVSRPVVKSPSQIPAGLTPLNPHVAAASAGWAPFGLPSSRRGAAWFWSFIAELDDLPTLPTLLAASSLAIEAPEGSSLMENPYVAEPNVTNEVAPGNPAASNLAVAIRARRHNLRSITSASLRRVMGGDNCRFLNFYAGPSKSFTSLRYQQLFEMGPSKALGLFRDKTVFVGFQDHLKSSRSDSFHTPGSWAETPFSGVELLATAFANLRDGTYLKIADDFALRGAALGGILALASLLISRSAFFIALESLIAWLFVERAMGLFAIENLWTPVAVPLAVMVPLALLFQRRIFKLRREAKQLAIISTLKRHVPRELVADLRRGEMRITTGVCICTDARNFTELSTRVSSTQLAQLLDDYYDSLIPVFLDAGGHVIDSAGDGLLAVFPGVSSGHETALLSINAATALLAAADDFDRRHNGYELSIRIGIAAGEFTLGVIGSTSRYFYKAIGQPINTAARLEALNKELGSRCLIESGILPTDTPRERLRDRDRHTLKGLKEPVTVVELI